MRVYNVAQWVLASLVLVVPVASAQAQAVGKPTAEANFASQTGCIATEVFVFARGGTGAKLVLTMSEIDECKDQMLLSAEGKVSLGGGGFPVGSDLGTATLDTTVPMTDRISKRRFTATVRLTWTAIEEAITAAVRVAPDEPGRFTRLGAPVQRTLRLAKAVGTVSDGKRNLTPGPAVDAAISAIGR